MEQEREIKRILGHRVYMYNTVSQKTSQLWLAITLTHMNGIWFFWQKCYR